MAQHIKKKLCWNCEGSVGFDQENCPFCGVYLSSCSTYGNEASSNISFEPPYKIIDDNETPKPPYEQTLENQEPSQKAFSLDNMFSSLSLHPIRLALFSLGSLLAGSVFFLFGIILFLFSKDGKLTLQWDADFWLYYLSISFILLFLGWKSLSNLEEE